jgi:hypothetical protein
VLRDPSKAVLAVALEAIDLLFREVFIKSEDPADGGFQALSKYIRVVITKLTPNLDLFILRSHWAEDGKHAGLFPLVCLLANVRIDD